MSATQITYRLLDDENCASAPIVVVVPGACASTREAEGFILDHLLATTGERFTRLDLLVTGIASVAGVRFHQAANSARGSLCSACHRSIYDNPATHRAGFCYAAVSA